MLTLRTPDERFTGLHDFDHQPGYAEVSNGAGGRLRIAYLAAGPPGGQVRFARVTRPDDPATEAHRAAWAALRRSEIPFLCAFSDGDPITGAVAPILRRTMPGAAGMDHPTTTGAGHFLQEDAGPELPRVVVEFAAHRG